MISDIWRKVPGVSLLTDSYDADDHRINTTNPETDLNQTKREPVAKPPHLSSTIGNQLIQFKTSLLDHFDWIFRTLRLWVHDADQQEIMIKVRYRPSLVFRTTRATSFG